MEEFQSPAITTTICPHSEGIESGGAALQASDDSAKNEIPMMRRMARGKDVRLLRMAGMDIRRYNLIANLCFGFYSNRAFFEGLGVTQRAQFFCNPVS